MSERVVDAYVKLPRRAAVTSSIEAGACGAVTTATFFSGPVLGIWGWLPLSVLAVLGTVVTISIPPWLIARRAVRTLRGRAACGRAANIVDEAMLAFGLSGREVSTVVVETQVANCGALPQRGGGVLVWVTTGLVSTLSRPQLEAVLVAQIAIGTDRRMQRAAVNEALLRIALCTFVFPFAFAIFSPATVVLPFMAIWTSRRWPHVALLRARAADAIAARTTLLPRALVEAFQTLGESTRDRYRITLAALVDPFSLTATGGEAVTRSGGRLVSTTTGTARATLKARGTHLRSLLTGEDTGLAFDELIGAESVATAEERWYPDPFHPTTPQRRRFHDGQWTDEIRMDEQQQFRPSTKPGWHFDPYLFRFGGKRWWDGTRWTGYTDPPAAPPGALPPDAKPLPPPRRLRPLTRMRPPGQ